MDATSHPLDDDVWQVGVPPYPLDVSTGIGVLVNPMFLAGENFSLHDHQYVLPHVPDPTRAVVTYQFDSPVAISKIEVVQHANGITMIEGFVGDSLESLNSVGAVFGPWGDVTGESVFPEGQRYTFDFDNSDAAGRVFQFVIRKTSLSDGWASYRAYAMDASGNRIQPAVLRGTVYSWGGNIGDCAGDGGAGPVCGQTGVSDAAVVTTPAARSDVQDAAALGAGMFHSLAVRADGTVWAWGMNGSGQLGSGGASGAHSAAPVQVPGFTDGVAVAGGWHHSLAIRRDGSLWSWGSGFTGLGGYSSFAAPTIVPGLSNVAALAAGESASFAVLSNGSLWSWGFNSGGVLGTGSPEWFAFSPVQITGLHDVTAVATHFSHALALTRDGTVWAWGSNASGQVGTGSYADQNTPIQVPGLTDIVQVGAGAQSSYALRGDGTVWTWGRHAGFDYLEPVPIGGLQDVVAISAGGFHLLARKADRSLWGWGSNAFGQLGVSTQTEFEWDPVAVEAAGPIDLLSAGRIHSLTTVPLDAAPPILRVPGDVIVDATSPAGALVEYSAAAADDVDPAPDLTCTPASGSVFPQGATSVTCTATDATGKVASDSFTVVVKDAVWQLQDAIGLVESWNLAVLGTSLTDKLRTAQAFLIRGKVRQACNTLEDLLSQVRAQRGRGLRPGQADDLVERATRIRHVIGC